MSCVSHPTGHPSGVLEHVPVALGTGAWHAGHQETRSGNKKAGAGHNAGDMTHGSEERHLVRLGECREQRTRAYSEIT